MAKALNKWNCDSCGTEIVGAENGWFEWYRDKQNGNIQTGFRIVHHDRQCMYNENVLFQDGKSVKDMHLNSFVGPHGLDRLLEILEREEVVNKSEVTEMIRRLHIPGYEEARFEDGE